jgi:hypothetical protein
MLYGEGWLTGAMSDIRERFPFFSKKNFPTSGFATLQILDVGICGETFLKKKCNGTHGIFFVIMGMMHFAL